MTECHQLDKFPRKILVLEIYVRKHVIFIVQLDIFNFVCLGR